MTEDLSAPGGTMRVAADVHALRVGIVNVVFVGAPGAGDRQWTLVDAGLQGTAGRIRRSAEGLFGEGSRPAAIVLTHGHFDHVGALRELAEAWEVPVYAHELELPYLDGRSAYPPPDPTVGGGAMARLSPLYPAGPFHFGDLVRTLPADGALPGMPDWRWIETPGHAPGHVSLWRDRDRTIIAGDAFTTTKQESMLAAATQRVELHGPPMYFTPDWESARTAVERLAALDPEMAITGHGRPLGSSALRAGLRMLARDWAMLAMPRQGRYVDEPAIADRDGVVSLPPAVPDPLPKVLMGVGALAALGLAARAMRRDRTPDTH